MSKERIKNQDIVNSIKTNNFMVALSTYRRAMLELNKTSTEWIKISTRKNNKSDLEFLEKKYDSSIDSAYSCIVDALSDLCYLYEVNELTNAGKYAVKSVFKFCMSKKDLRPIIKRACKKSKKCSMNKLYKKYKNKIKVED